MLIGEFDAGTYRNTRSFNASGMATPDFER
jgi:hypothetical protein